MKKIALAILFMGCLTSVKAQLKNTKWSGVMAIPDEMNVYLKFTDDTAEIILQDNGFVGEIMNYSVKDSVITFKKISGNSPCNSDPFTVTFSIKDNKLTIKSLLDPCDPRVSSWPTKPFELATSK